jgi:hypothetical protein
MAVLAEAISVIIRKQAIDDRIDGGMTRLTGDLPNRTFCEDEHLCRLGFLSPAETAAFNERLQQLGLRFADREGQALDFAVVDQQHGPTLPTPWLIFGKLPCDAEGHMVSACWLDREHEVTTDEPTLSAGALALPIGWRYDASLSRNFHFTPNPAE